MSDFDKENAYQAKGDGVFFDDGREIRLLHYVYKSAAKIRNDPSAVLAAIDAYARSDSYLMNVGAQKGAIVTSLVAEVAPAIMIELGGYIGYSTILFADAARKANPKAKYFSFERNPEFAAVISGLVDLAGLRDTVRVVVGPSDEGIVRAKEEGLLGKQIDMMFLDHYKPAYTTDLKLCEQLGLIGEGTVLAADNVVTPGNPPYLAYVRSTVAEKRARLKDAANGKASDAEAFADRTSKQYATREGEEKLDASRTGNPDLIYESKLMDSWEPTGEKDGVEVTRCKGVEKS